VFLAIEGVLLVALGVGALATWTWPVYPQAQAILVSVIGTWLCFSLPVAVLYLLGRPPEMNLSPLWPSARERSYWREVGGRPELTDEEFYDRFYEGSGVPPDIPARIRRCLADLDILIERAYPADRIPHADDELDYADVLFRIEREFVVRFTETDYALFTGTLGNLIDVVHDRLRGRRSSSGE